MSTNLNVAGNWLCDRLEEFCKAEGLPHISADDLLAQLQDESGGEDRQRQIEWLHGFVATWDMWENADPDRQAPNPAR